MKQYPGSTCKLHAKYIVHGTIYATKIRNIFIPLQWFLVVI